MVGFILSGLYTHTQTYEMSNFLNSLQSYSCNVDERLITQKN